MAAPDDKDGREKSAFVVFWSSLPGILTGVAAVIGAVAALAALFLGNGGSGSPAPADSTPSQTQTPPASSVPAPTQSSATASAAGGGCFPRYFKGIPRDRIAQLEAGAMDHDVIGPGQPKAGAVGLRFTNNNRSIGAMRFDFLPTASIFRIESVVNGRCSTIADYSDTTRSEPNNVLLNNDHFRLRLGGSLYDMTFDAGTTIRLNFVPFTP